MGVIKVDRPKRRSIGWALRIHEELIITSQRVLVIRKWIEHFLPPGAYQDYFWRFLFGAYYKRKDAKNKKEIIEKEKQPKTLEELLMDHKENFAIANSEILKVELKASSCYTI